MRESIESSWLYIGIKALLSALPLLASLANACSALSRRSTVLLAAESLDNAPLICPDMAFNSPESSTSDCARAMRDDIGDAQSATIIAKPTRREKGPSLFLVLPT